MATTSAPAELHFTPDPEANRLIASDPNALLIGFALDQQVTVQKAFSGPLEIKRRLGHLDPARIAATPPEDLAEALPHEAGDPPLSRRDGRARAEAVRGDRRRVRRRRRPGVDRGDLGRRSIGRWNCGRGNCWFRNCGANLFCRLLLSNECRQVVIRRRGLFRPQEVCPRKQNVATGTASIRLRAPTPMAYRTDANAAERHRGRGHGSDGRSLPQEMEQGPSQ